jgi:hypothetical protein
MATEASMTPRAVGQPKQQHRRRDAAEGHLGERRR